MAEIGALSAIYSNGNNNLTSSHADRAAIRSTPVAGSVAAGTRCWPRRLCCAAV